VWWVALGISRLSTLPHWSLIKGICKTMVGVVFLTTAALVLSRSGVVALDVIAIVVLVRSPPNPWGVTNSSRSDPILDLHPTRCFDAEPQLLCSIIGKIPIG
jgi:hypothetical protein